MELPHVDILESVFEKSPAVNATKKEGYNGLSARYLNKIQIDG
jgi:hypothetical protein